MNKIFFNILILLISFLFSASSYSKNGIYDGYDLYKDCKASRDIINNHDPHFTDPKKYQDHLLAAIQCSAYIDAIFDFAVGETDLIQNKGLKKINKPNLVATKEFYATHYFCMPKNLPNTELILSVVSYIESEIKNNKIGKEFLVLPASYIILYSFHENFPCEL